MKPKVAILGLGRVMVPKRSLFVTEDFAEEDGELAAHHHQETFDEDVLSLSELELTFRDFHESSETEDGHDSVNVTRDEHDVDNVNDDDFYIQNKNDLMIQARHVQLKNISQP